MPIYPENFVANALSGTILVTNGFANVTLPTNPFALEGDKNFVIRLRKGGVNGLVIATSPTITVRDTSQLVSLTANISTVAEGNLVTFTLVTANATDNSNVFYSVFPVTANVNTADFVGANVGRATIINNQATFTLFANADYSLVDETSETFRIQLRENSPTGNIIYNTSNVAITDFYKRINVFGFTESARSIAEGSSVTFTVSAHNITSGTLLYYYTSGNADITGSNTGSIAMNSVSNTITITTSSTIPANQSRSFNLILSESNLGSPVATSNAITVVDSALAYLNATGGTVTTIDGFRIHTFTSSGELTVTNGSTAAINTANILSIAGGGGGGRARGGGGGGGGFVFESGLSLSSNLTIVIGAGGSGANVTPVFSKNGANTTVTGGAVSIISVGGGGGGGSSGYGGAGGPGGSGGGGGFAENAGSGFGFPGPTQQGFPGASNGGGGGGASQAGLNNGPPSAPTGGPAKGGDGRPSLITGANVIYAGGGGGRGNGTPFGYPGGSGGGGASAPDNSPYAPSGTPGTANLGGGGGAGVEATAGPGGNGGSGVVIIRYPWRPPAFFSSVTANSTTISHGSNAFFVVNTLNANATTLFYDTVGNVTSASFVGGNTGSFTVASNATVLRLQTVQNVPNKETRNFQIRIREDSATGNIALISSEVVVAGNNYVNQYIQATGGTVTTIDGFRVHTFTSSNTFSITNASQALIKTANILAIAGGGGGGGTGGLDGAGGGAGGYVIRNNVALDTNSYSITIGSGGAGSATSGGQGTNGANTSVTATNFANVLAVGGGGGGGAGGKNGGSGGGGSPAGSGFGYPGPTEQGYPGGVSSTGGGGGATQAGATNVGGKGGDGIASSITGASVTYAGGGGGGRNPTAGAGAGGAGGGGPGVGSGNGTDGLGGGGGGSPGFPAAGAGGSGVVIIRYPWVPPAFFTSVTANVSTVIAGANAFFVINTSFANAITLFYDTVGNVTSSNFVGGNTGSFTITSNATVLRLQTIANIPTTRFFALRIREDSATGNIALISSNVSVVDSNLLINATGGTETISGGYKIHTFTTSGNLIVNSVGTTPGQAEIMIVAGGGAGGATGEPNGGAAGGGAGGLLYYGAETPKTPNGNAIVLGSSTYEVTVGGGAAAGSTRGGNSSFVGGAYNFVSIGGGRGGDMSNGSPGGSGGGRYAGTNGLGTPGQGFPGGSPGGDAPEYAGSGGGGASEAGAAGKSPGPSKGGDGLRYLISGANVAYAGGGGGGGRSFSGAGGLGGGGPGGPSVPPTPGTPGTVNTGGGGGGVCSPTGSGAGSGGSGIVIIRYPYA